MSNDFTKVARALLRMHVTSYSLIDATREVPALFEMKASAWYDGEVQSRSVASTTDLDLDEPIVVLSQAGHVPVGLAALFADLMGRELVGVSVSGDRVVLRGALEGTLDVREPPKSDLVMTLEQEDGVRRVFESVKLPLRVELEIPARGGRFQVRWSTRQSQLVFPQGPAGTYELELDLDDTNLSASSARGPLTVTPVSAPSPVRLYLAFDASSADLEAIAEHFAGATASDEQAARLDALAGVTAEPRPSSRNRRLRTLVGAALERAVPAEIPVELYWFAEEGQSGAVGRGAESIAARMLDGIFEHRAGVEAVDAVDEVLVRIVRDVSRARQGDRPVVVLIGDSPPPPAHANDPMMPVLFDRPRVGTRFSTTLEQSLAALSSVDFAYIYVRPFDPSAEIELPRSYLEFAERVHEALSVRFPRVIAADRAVDDLARAIREALVPRKIPSFAEAS